MPRDLTDWWMNMLWQRTKKMESCRSQWLTQQRRDFFARKDAALTAAQLDCKNIHDAVQTEQKAPTLFIPERTALASLIGSEDMRSTSMRADKAAAVQTMAALCS